MPESPWEEEPNDLAASLIPEARIGKRTKIPDRVGEKSSFQRRSRLKQPIMTPEQIEAQERRKQRIERKLAVKEKHRRCLELRKSGATYEQIAQVVGYSSGSTVATIVKKQLEKSTQEAGADLRTLQIERLNHIMLVLWPKVQGGDVNAIDRFLRVQNEINNLQGVYAPQKTEHKHEVTAGVLVVEGDKDDYIRALQQMAGRNESQEGEADHTQPALPPGGDDQIIDAIVVEDEKEPDPVLDAPAKEDSLITGPVACERFVVSIDPKDQIKQKCGGCGLPRYKH